MPASEKGAPLPVFELLVYPVVNNDMNTESYQQNATAKPLNKAMMGWFFDNYLADKASATDPHVTPMQASWRSCRRR